MTDQNQTASATVNVEAEQRYCRAALSMLLGARKLKDGLIMMSGGVPDQAGLLWLGQAAAATNTDLLRLGFVHDAAGVTLADISVALPRDRGCFINTGCRLWLPRTGHRALLLPQPEQRGHFRFSPRELIHVDGKPDDVDGGMRRAEQRLHQLAARGLFLPDQACVTELPIAA